MEMERDEILKHLKNKRISFSDCKKLVNAEKRVLNAVLRYVNNDETTQLNTILNHKNNVVDQIEYNLSLAIRYITDNDADSIALSYMKNADKCCTELDKIKNDKHYLALHDKYIDNASQFLQTEEDSKEVE